MIVLGLALAMGAGAIEAQPRPRPLDSGPMTPVELVEARGLSGLAVSPDGAFVAVRQEEQKVAAGVTQFSWVVVPVKGGAPRRIADAGVAPLDATGSFTIERPAWSPDSQWLFYRSAANEESQVWRASRDGSVQQQLTHSPSDVLAFAVDDGKLHYATRGPSREEIKAAEKREYDNGVLLDRTLIPGQAIIRNVPVNGRMTTLRRMPGIGYSTLLGGQPSGLWTLDLASGTREKAAGDVIRRFETSWSITPGRFSEYGQERITSPATRKAAIASADSRRIAAVERREAGQGRRQLASRSAAYLISHEAATGSQVVCEHETCLDADSIALVGWRGGDVVFQTATFGREALHLWDPNRNGVRTLLAIDGALGAHRSGATGLCQLAKQEAVCIRSSAGEPPALIAIDLGTGRQRTLYDPNPHLTPEKLGVVEKISVSDRFGSTAFGWLVLPRSRPAGQRLPLVITSYTCPGFLLGGSGSDVPEHVLAGQGFAAVCLELGSFHVRERPGTDQAVTGWDSNVDMFEDIIAQLDRRGLIDPKRVAVTGFSASASSTTYGLTRTDRFAAAIVTTQGYLDPITAYLRGATGENRSYAQQQGRELPYDNPAYYPKSPALRAGRIVTPLLMQLAEVEYPGMMQLFSGMLDYGRSVEMWIFADAYHFKYQPRQRLAVYNRNVDWLNFWLRGIESGLARDVGQYDRWRKMKEAQCSLAEASPAPGGAPWYCRSSAE